MSDQSERLKAIGEQPLMRDDKVYGEVRRQIALEYVTSGQPKPERNWLYSRLVEARSRVQSEIRKREEAERLLRRCEGNPPYDELSGDIEAYFGGQRGGNDIHGGCGLPGHESEVEHGKD